MSLGRIRKNKQTCFLFINIDYMDWLFSFSFFILSNAYIILDLFHHVYYSRKNASIIWQGLATVANFCTYRSLLYCVGKTSADLTHDWHWDGSLSLFLYYPAHYFSQCSKISAVIFCWWFPSHPRCKPWNHSHYITHHSHCCWV